MAFMLYNRKEVGKKTIYKNTGESFSLAGYNLIYNAWINMGQPINKGWSISRDYLSSLIKKEGEYAFLIDFDPTADWRIGIIEIDNIHIYTYGDKTKKIAYWSPLMLELRDIIYFETEDEEFDIKDKNKFLQKISTESDDTKKSVEFLYLNGTDKSWNWGKNGMTNAAFIQNEARDYFREFF
jgi:hypothetical protein